jgi:hypothetical protein
MPFSIVKCYNINILWEGQTVVKKLVLEHHTVSHPPIQRKSEQAGRLYFERIIMRRTGSKSAGKMHVYTKVANEWRYSHTIALVSQLGKGK